MSQMTSSELEEYKTLIGALLLLRGDRPIQLFAEACAFMLEQQGYTVIETQHFNEIQNYMRQLLQRVPYPSRLAPNNPNFPNIYI